MRTIIILLILISYQAIHSQPIKIDCDKYTKKSGAVISLKNHKPNEGQKNISRKIISELHDCSKSLLDSIELSKIHLQLSGLKYHLSNDSIEFTKSEIIDNIIQSFTYDKTHFCKVFINNNYPEEDSRDQFFVRKIDDEKINNIKKYCHTNFEASIKKPYNYSGASKNNPLTTLKEVLKNDQLYRSANNISDLTRQAQIDSKNRILLDSLYKIHKFPTEEEIGRKGQDIYFLVLMHSEDCIWNQKWLKIFLSAYDNL